MSTTAIAYHEAGHCVVAIRGGVPVARVTIEPTGPYCRTAVPMGARIANWSQIERVAGALTRRTAKQQFVEGDYAYIVWTAETADNVYECATDTFVVRDSKIIAQSFAGKITAKGGTHAARGRHE